MCFFQSEAISGSQLEFTLSELHPSTKYNVYMISINPHGSSQPTYIIDIITQSAHPASPEQMSLNGIIHMSSINIICPFQYYVVHWANLMVYKFKDCTNLIMHLLLECCERRGVTGTCKDFLCMGRAPTASEEDKLQCYSQIDHVLSCVAGEYINRTREQLCTPYNTVGHVSAHV